MSSFSDYSFDSIGGRQLDVCPVLVITAGAVWWSTFGSVSILSDCSCDRVGGKHLAVFPVLVIPAVTALVKGSWLCVHL